MTLPVVMTLPGWVLRAESYFSRLFAPENLPNIGLFFAGVVLGGRHRTFVNYSEFHLCAKMRRKAESLGFHPGGKKKKGKGKYRKMAKAMGEKV